MIYGGVQIIIAPPTIFPARLNSPAWNVGGPGGLVPGGADDLSAGSRRLVRRTLPRQPLWAGITGHEKVGVWLLTCRAYWHICTFQWALPCISTSAHFSELISTFALTDFIIKYHEHIIESEGQRLAFYKNLQNPNHCNCKSLTLCWRAAFILIESQWWTKQTLLQKMKWTKQMLLWSLILSDDLYFSDAWCMVVFLCV